MADTIASTVVSRLTTRVIDKWEEEVKLVKDAKEDVFKLKGNLRAIKAVLADAEQRQLTQDSIRNWIDNLKDVSYDIDDVLDEWSTKIQRAGREGRGSVSNDFVSFVLPLCNYVAEVFPFIPFPCFGCEEICLRRDIALQIKKLNSRLEEIASQRNTYQLREISINENPPARPHTISAVDATEVIGRDVDKQNVIRRLMGESSETPSLRVISIVGVGGLGKSTLAQLVFNDPEVMNVYFKRIWIHVSNTFDVIKVANAILGSLGDKPSNDTGLETISQKIQELIKDKSFLLVLDDVWNKDPEEWKPIRNSLLGGSPNSRILVTTQNENVAILMGCMEPDMVHLGELSAEDSWSLFSQLAFSSRIDTECLDLKEIGEQLVAKCHGLPLAIRTLGSYLSRKNKPRWLSVLGSEKWIEVAKISLVPSLWFSYIDLTSDLKQCFSYCSVFPKGYRIVKYKLIEQWMAQGYLSGRRGEDEEMVGEDYFKDLAARSFFQNFEKDEDDDSVVACRMHDMVHDLAQHIAGTECHHVEVRSSGDDIIKMESSSTVQPRHSNIVVTNQTMLPTHFENLKKLRTLFVKYKSHLKLETKTLDDDLFSKLNCLRSLDLSFCGLKQIPSSISSLILLRWLDLSENWWLEELPEELCELNNLQTLDISSCVSIRKLPQGIGKLVKLKHLRNYDCWASTPKGIGRLICLRTLEFFVLSNDGEAATLGDLKSLKNIQGRLTIILMGDVADLVDANQVHLKERDLTNLELQFSGSGRRDKQVLEALEAPPSLRNLGISAYWGSSVFPNWLLSLTSLRKLKLSNCKRCEQLPSLGKLKHLEHLRILGFGEVKKVGIEFLGVETSYEDDHTHELEIFPKLAKLEFGEMPKWEAWNDSSNSRNVAIMPHLRYLRLDNCQELKVLPKYVLQHPTLERVVTSSFTLLKNYRNNERPNITHDRPGLGYLKFQLRGQFIQGVMSRIR